MKIKVSECENCPLFSTLYTGGETDFVCGHPGRDPKWNEASLIELPESCPLRQDSLTIELEE